MAWVWVHRVFECSQARSGARLVLLALAKRANEDGECWPAASDIARRCKLSVGQVRRHLRTLQDIGEVEIIVPGGGLRPGSTKGFSNRYAILLPDPDDDSQDENAEETPSDGTCAPMLGFADPTNSSCAPMHESLAPMHANPSADAREPARQRYTNRPEPSKNQLTNRHAVISIFDASATAEPGRKAFLHAQANQLAGQTRLAPDLSPLIPPAPVPKPKPEPISEPEQVRTRAMLAGVKGLSAFEISMLAERFRYSQIEQAVTKLGTGFVRDPARWLTQAVEAITQPDKDRPQ